MPVTHVIESFSEFRNRHGGQCLKDDRGRFIFPNGAIATQDYRGAWALREPSSAIAERLEIARLYWSIRVQRAERDFRIMKATLAGGRIEGQTMPGRFKWDEREFGPPPSADGTVALRHLRSIVLERRASLEKVDDEIFQLPENIEKRKLEKEIEKERLAAAAKTSDAVDEIEKITI